jgi:hypothetical protein
MIYTNEIISKFKIIKKLFNYYSFFLSLKMINVQLNKLNNKQGQTVQNITLILSKYLIIHMNEG